MLPCSVPAWGGEQPVPDRQFTGTGTNASMMWVMLVTFTSTHAREDSKKRRGGTPISAPGVRTRSCVRVIIKGGGCAGM